MSTVDPTHLIALIALSVALGAIAAYGWKGSNHHTKYMAKLKRRRKRRYWRKCYKSNARKPGWIE